MLEAVSEVWWGRQETERWYMVSVRSSLAGISVVCGDE